MMFVGRSRPLSSNGIAAVATNLSVNIQEVWTVVVNVETSGCGFLPDRRPQLLYERHIFAAMTLFTVGSAVGGSGR